MQPQFDAKVTSKDGKMMLFIRGPFEVPDGFGFELRMVPVVEMAKWPVIAKSEEVENVSNNESQGG